MGAIAFDANAAVDGNDFVGGDGEVGGGRRAVSESGAGAAESKQGRGQAGPESPAQGA